MQRFFTPMQLKTVLVGATGAGKSSIVERYVQGTFNAETQSTITASYFSKRFEHNGEQFVLNIWDTAGQERYQAVTSMYFRGAQFAIIVFDLTDADSFGKVDFWRKEIQQKSQAKTRLLLVGNKADLGRDVASGPGYAADNGLEYFEVSAKTGQGVDGVFGTIMTLSGKLATERREEQETPGLKVGQGAAEAKSGCC